MRIINKEDFISELMLFRKEFHDNYYAMYSSVIDGIILEPLCMMVPIDDHIVHRGDGVFEALNCFEGKIFNLEGHLSRLEKSCRLLEYEMPLSRAGMVDIILATVKAGGHPDCSLRIYISRGQGGFGVNPYECEKCNFYVVVTKRKPWFMDRHPGGASVDISRFPPKRDIFAVSKNCNYIVNVMMMKEAVDSGVDFVVSVDEDGYVAEGATENIGLINDDGWLLFPEIDGLLAGTTMLRVMKLGKRLVDSGELKGVKFARLHSDDFKNAREVMMVGTTLNVTAVYKFCGHEISGGKPGELAIKLNEMLIEDIYSNSKLETGCFEGCECDDDLGT